VYGFYANTPQLFGEAVAYTYTLSGMFGLGIEYTDDDTSWKNSMG
jgi:hypothetical protein